MDEDGRDMWKFSRITGLSPYYLDQLFCTAATGQYWESKTRSPVAWNPAGAPVLRNEYIQKMKETFAEELNLLSSVFLNLFP